MTPFPTAQWMHNQRRRATIHSTGRHCSNLRATWRWCGLKHTITPPSLPWVLVVSGTQHQAKTQKHTPHGDSRRAYETSNGGVNQAMRSQPGWAVADHQRWTDDTAKPMQTHDTVALNIMSCYPRLHTETCCCPHSPTAPTYSTAGISSGEQASVNPSSARSWRIASYVRGASLSPYL